MPAAPATTPAKPRRLRTIVPAPTPPLRGSGGSIEGLELLDDMERVVGLPEDDPLAVALWLAVRRVFTWADTPAESRRRLRGKGRVFRSCAEEARDVVPELAGALRLLPALWTRPERVEPRKVADACDQVARWAADGGLMRTAGMFMEAAAAAEPENALRAMDAGVLCQRLGGVGMLQRAEQWYQRAFGLARVAIEGRRLLSIRALLAYGNFARDTGDYPLARKCYEKAARRAHRCEAWFYYGIAHHNLLGLVVVSSEDLDAAEVHARAALHHYPRGHSRLPVLVHDYAALLNRHHQFSSALLLLDNLPPLIEQPEIRLLAYGNLALAAAGANRRAVFENAVRSALPLCPLHADFAPYAFVLMARGALVMGLQKRAQCFARRALSLATARADADAIEAAKEVLEECKSEMQPHLPASPPLSSPNRILLELSAAVAPPPRPLRTEAPEDGPRAPVDAAPRRSQHRTAPAPRWPLWGGFDTLAGLTVLQEADCIAALPADHSLSLVLWTALRNAHAWAGATQEERAAVFPATRSSEREHGLFFGSQIPELRDALGIFAVVRSTPELIDCGQMAGACDQVARWASGRGLMRTALYFAEAASAAEPENALRAIDAGLMCQRLGGIELLQRAEQWHQHACCLARASKRSHRLLTIRALLAYGNFARDTGDYPLARDCYEKAARRACRYARWTYYGIAHHNLLGLVVVSSEDLDAAEVHARAALHHYPRGHSRLPVLVHDYAALLNRHHHFSSALLLLENLPPLIEQPEIRLLAYGNLALAAAGANRPAVFDNAVRSALPLCPLHADFAPYALVLMAKGASLCREYDRAVEYVEVAWRAAIARADNDLIAVASRLRDSINKKEPVARAAGVLAPSTVMQFQRVLRARQERAAKMG